MHLSQTHIVYVANQSCMRTGDGASSNRAATLCVATRCDCCVQHMHFLEVYHDAGLQAALPPLATSK
jgi:hypothetical protein